MLPTRRTNTEGFELRMPETFTTVSVIGHIYSLQDSEKQCESSEGQKTQEIKVIFDRVAQSWELRVGISDELLGAFLPRKETLCGHLCLKRCLVKGFS